MLLSTAEDLAKFVDELKEETDRGLPLVATALLDHLLQETLRAFFCEVKSVQSLLDEGNGPLSTFSSRINACHALGLIDDYEWSEVTLLRKIRNLFAHRKHGFDFDDSTVRGLCYSLKSDLPQGEGYDLASPRFRFTNATVCLALRLYHRPDWVMLERRKAKEWVPAQQTTWRSFKDEPPPEGSPVIVIGKPRS
jgi:mannitol operon repressor